MEITFENRLRRTEQLVRPDGTRKGTAAETEEAAVPAAGAQADRVSTSQDAVQRAVAQLDAQSQRLMALVQQDQQKEKKPYIWDMLDGEEKTGNSEADALGEQMKTMERCHKIASRIMRGDKVPPQDEQYLMMNDPDGYKLALAMRKPKKKPKEWESVLKDEEKEQSQEAESSGGEAVESSGEAGESGASGGDVSSGEE